MPDSIEARRQPIRRWLDAGEEIEPDLAGTRGDLGHGPCEPVDAIRERPADQ